MSEPGTTLVASLAGRLPAAAIFAVAVGALTALLGLLRLRGAMAAVAWLAIALLIDGWSMAGFLAVAIALTGLAARLIEVTSGGHDETAVGARPVTAVCVVTIVIALGGTVEPHVGLWQAAAGAAGAAAVAAWCGILVTSKFPGRPLHPFLLRPSTHPGLSGSGLVAAAVSAATLTMVAIRLDVVGPGDGGFVAVAALAGVLAATVPSAAGHGLRWTRMLLAATVAAAGAGFLVALVP